LKTDIVQSRTMRNPLFQDCTCIPLSRLPLLHRTDYFSTHFPPMLFSPFSETLAQPHFAAISNVSHARRSSIVLAVPTLPPIHQSTATNAASKRRAQIHSHVGLQIDAGPA